MTFEAEIRWRNTAGGRVFSVVTCRRWFTSLRLESFADSVNKSEARKFLKYLIEKTKNLQDLLNQVYKEKMKEDSAPKREWENPSKVQETSILETT